MKLQLKRLINLTRSEVKMALIDIIKTRPKIYSLRRSPNKYNININRIDFPDHKSYRKARDILFKRARAMEMKNTSPKYYYIRLKISAKQKKKEFDIPFSEFIKFWNTNCYYCNSEIIGIKLDRVDTTVGYILSNIVQCCTICNYAKSDLPVQEFEKYLFQVYSYIK